MNKQIFDSKEKLSGKGEGWMFGIVPPLNPQLRIDISQHIQITRREKKYDKYSGFFF